jgi:hypothetical protein
MRRRRLDFCLEALLGLAHIGFRRHGIAERRVQRIRMSARLVVEAGFFQPI